MTWFKVDDGFHAHPKILAISLAARGLWVTCGAYCASQLTDGFVPAAVVRMHNGLKAARELVTAGLWDEELGGYQFHDWKQFQPAANDVKSQRDQAAERKRRSRMRHTPVTRDEDVTDETVTRDTTVAAVPPARRPDPTRPKEQPPNPPAPPGGHQNFHDGQHPNCRQCATNPRGRRTDIFAHLEEAQ